MGKFRRYSWWKGPSLPKIEWKHDGWMFHRIYERVKENQHQAKIVLVLSYLHANLSVKRITEITGESRINIVTWAKEYKKKGLQNLLGISIAVPTHFRNRIERYVRQNPNILSQLSRLVTDDDYEMYGEEMEVDGYALSNWVYELELGGTDARKAAIYR
jgi:hypothetical protein